MNERTNPFDTPLNESRKVYLNAEGGGSLSRQLLATDVATGDTKELLTPEGAGREEDFSLEEKVG